MEHGFQFGVIGSGFLGAVDELHSLGEPSEHLGFLLGEGGETRGAVRGDLGLAKDEGDEGEGAVVGHMCVCCWVCGKGSVISMTLHWRIVGRIASDLKNFFIFYFNNFS